MTAQETREAAAYGARLLDEYWPGWTEAISLDDLDIDQGWYNPDSDLCPKGCILAQLGRTQGSNGYGAYSDGKAILDAKIRATGDDHYMPVEWVEDAGFSRSTCTAFEDLNGAWAAEVYRRRLVAEPLQ